MTTLPRSPLRRFLPYAGFAVLSLLMYRPSPSRLGSELYANIGDPCFTTFVLLWDSHALVSQPLHLFDASIFWPHHSTLAYSENLLPLVALFAPVHILTGNPILAINVLVIALNTFSQITTYLLARRVTGRADVAMLAAVGFAFTSYVFVHTGHVQLLSVGWFPLCFLLVLRLLEEPRPGRAIAFALASAGLFLSSLYYGAIYFVCVATIVLGYLIARRRQVGWVHLRCLALAGVVTGAVLAPFALPYLQVQDEQPERGGAENLSLDLRDLAAPDRNSLLYGDLGANAAARPFSAEHAMFPGFSTFVLAGVGAVAMGLGARRRQGTEPGRPLELALVTLAGVVAAALAFGPSAAGHRGLLWDHLAGYLPGVEGIRAPGRLAIPAMLALSLLAAWGLAALTARVRRPLREVLVGAAVVLLVAELAVTTVPSQPLERDDTTLAAYRALDDRPAGAVLELPVADITNATPPGWTAEAPRLIYATTDWNPRFNGYSGYAPLEYAEQSRVLNTFPSAEALELADALDLRYVIVHVGTVNGYPQLTEEEAATIVRRLPAEASATRHGRDWLIDLDAGPQGGQP